MGIKFLSFTTQYVKPTTCIKINITMVWKSYIVTDIWMIANLLSKLIWWPFFFAFMFLLNLKETSMNNAKHIILTSVINVGETKFMILIHARSKQHILLKILITQFMCLTFWINLVKEMKMCPSVSKAIYLHVNYFPNQNTVPPFYAFSMKTMKKWCPSWPHIL